MSDTTPYDEIDRNVRELCRALNAFEGIRTVGSCGGHEGGRRCGGWPSGAWYVAFGVDFDPEGHFSLEFLAWLVNHDMRNAGRRVLIYPDSPPPWLNEPGRSLRFILEGSEDPEEMARRIDKLRAEYIVDF